MSSKKIKIPKTMWNRDVEIDNKKKRKLVYIKESIVFSFIVVLIDSLGFVINKSIDTIIVTNNKIINIMIVIIFTFILSFLISYILDYIVSEYKIKKYKKNLRY